MGLDFVCDDPVELETVFTSSIVVVCWSRKLSFLSILARGVNDRARRVAYTRALVTSVLEVVAGGGVVASVLLLFFDFRWLEQSVGWPLTGPLRSCLRLVKLLEALCADDSDVVRGLADFGIAGGAEPSLVCCDTLPLPIRTLTYSEDTIFAASYFVAQAGGVSSDFLSGTATLVPDLQVDPLF